MSLRTISAIDAPALDKHHTKGWSYKSHFLFKSASYYAGGPCAGRRRHFLTNFLKLPCSKFMWLHIHVGIDELA